MSNIAIAEKVNVGPWLCLIIKLYNEFHIYIHIYAAQTSGFRKQTLGDSPW